MSQYRGFSWPFRMAGSEFPASATDDELIAQDLTRLFRISRNGRIMRRDLGTRAMGFVFENNDALLEENVRTEVLTAVGRYDDRIILSSVNLERNANELLIRVEYTIRSTSQRRQVAIPIPVM